MVRNTFRAAPSAAPRGAVAGGGGVVRSKGGERGEGGEFGVWHPRQRGLPHAPNAAARNYICKIKKMVPTMYKQGERLDRTHRSAQQVVGAPLSTSHQSIGAHKDEKAFRNLCNIARTTPKVAWRPPGWLTNTYEMYLRAERDPPHVVQEPGGPLVVGRPVVEGLLRVERYYGEKNGGEHLRVGRGGR